MPDPDPKTPRQPDPRVVAEPVPPEVAPGKDLDADLIDKGMTAERVVYVEVFMLDA